ncbi:hypothetical protein GN958_ATG16957, partial [Phytophthora infestans]
SVPRQNGKTSSNKLNTSPNRTRILLLQNSSWLSGSAAPSEPYWHALHFGSSFSNSRPLLRVY